KTDLGKLEAAKALAHLPGQAAAEPLTAIVSNPEANIDVRIAAADALKYYRTFAVARALSGVLGDRDFGVAWQARRSLEFITGRDYRYDEGAWLAYFSGPDKPLG